MKIKLSKSQWEQAGRTAGWIKEAGPYDTTSGYSGKDLYHDIQRNNKAIPKSNGMMPGQTPYTDEEKEKLAKLISDAAKGDPGEQGEESDPYKKMRHIKVTFDDGEVLETQINGTRKEVTDYYTKNQFVKADEVTMQRGVKVEFLD
jgi:hypothetical protein